MTSNLLKAAQRAMFASLLVAAVAACSTAPVTQTAALPQAQGWVDSAQVPVGADAPNGLESNAEGGN